jgi:hypothetical protein
VQHNQSETNVTPKMLTMMAMMEWSIQAI